MKIVFNPFLHFFILNTDIMVSSSFSIIGESLKGFKLGIKFKPNMVSVKAKYNFILLFFFEDV